LSESGGLASQIGATHDVPSAPSPRAAGGAGDERRGGTGAGLMGEGGPHDGGVVHGGDDAQAVTIATVRRATGQTPSGHGDLSHFPH
jgi:hypothetical protein